jgi:signal transduction histidine kinase
LLPEDRERVQGEVRGALERGARFAYLERIARPDGTIRVLDTIGDVIKGPTGNILGLIGTCRDVTEERQRDERLVLFAEIVRNVQIALFVWRADDEAPHTVRLVAANAAADRVMGVDLAARIGVPLETLFPAAGESGFSEALESVLREGGVREIHGHRFPVVRTGQVFDLKVFALSGRSVGVAVEDITARVRARELQAAERRVLEMVASSASLERVLELIVLAIEAFSPGTIASILLLDAEGTHLRHGAAPSLPEEFNRLVDGHAIGPLAGSCGTAAFERTSVFVTDIETDARWADYRHLAAIARVRACWSTPLVATDGRVLGTFALYYREPREPSPADLELVGRAAHITQIAIQRRQLDDAMRALSGHIEAAREDERTGIAREIHDELGQGLTAIKLDVAWIGRRTKNGAVEPRDLQERLDSITEMIDSLVHRVRRISSELRPGVLDDLGLEAAVEWQCREFEKRTGVTCALESKLHRSDIDRNLATAFFRMLQESLTNVARHANATRVNVRLACENDRLWLEVRDDGRGISRQAISSPKSLGILGIQERARRVGGVLTVESAESHGTTLRMEAPFVRTGREGMR